MAPLLGQLLDLQGEELAHANRYKVGRVIGEGGMGKVLLGYDTQLAREVAIKVMTTDTGDADRQRFYREAHLLASLRHPSIVQLTDYSGAAATRQYLVMERLSGRTLTELVAQRRLSDHACIAVAYSLLDALDHAHTAGIVHRDIKPDNVFVEPDGRVVLIDFGLAKGTATQSTRQTFLRGATRLLGTPEFAAPELLDESASFSAQSDLFSLGATLYFASAGAPPFSGAILELVTAIVSKPHRPLTEHGASAELSRVIDALLAKEPNARPASAKAARRSLEGALTKIGAVSPASIIARELDGSKVATKARSRVFGESGKIESLVDLRAKGALSDAALLRLARGLFAILAQAHAAGVVHRGVQPENVHIEPDGRVVLLDGAPSDEYAAPEDRATFASDLYGAGATLCFAITGAPPRGGPVAPLVDKLMDKNPTKRPASAVAASLLVTAAAMGRT